MTSRRAMLAIFAVVALLVPVQGARAGTFTVRACGPTSSAGAWQPTDTFSEGLLTGNACGGSELGPIASQGPTDTGALFAEDALGSAAHIPEGSEAGWMFSAPPGTTVTGLSYYRSMHAYLEPDLVPGLWTAEGTILESCQSPREGTHECNSLNNQVPISFLGLNTTSLFFGVRCHIVDGGEYCLANAGPNHAAQADLYSAQVTLSEVSSPTVSSISGAAWNGGFLAGQIPLTLSAYDYSGIAGVEVRSSLGKVLASVPETCDYYIAIPCPNLSGATFDLNTAATTDGSQDLIVQVKNAAGNATSETSQPVTIDNHGPGVPTGLTATLDRAQVVLSWQDPAFLAVPLGQGYVQLCQATCAVPLAVGSTGVARIPIPPAGSYTVHLYLMDAAGKSSPVVSVPLAVPSSAGKAKEKLRALIDSHGRLYVAGPIPKDVNAVRVCWHSKRGKQALGSRCVTLHVRHRRIAVTFHPSARARRGHIIITVTKGRSLIARLTATKTRFM